MSGSVVSYPRSKRPCPYFRRPYRPELPAAPPRSSSGGCRSAGQLRPQNAYNPGNHPGFPGICQFRLPFQVPRGRDRCCICAKAAWVPVPPQWEDWSGKSGAHRFNVRMCIGGEHRLPRSRNLARLLISCMTSKFLCLFPCLLNGYDAGTNLKGL